MVEKLIKNYKYELSIFSILFIIYSFLSYSVTITNDSVTNIEQISSLDILSRSSHFTFHFFGVGFFIVLNTVFGLSVVISTQFMLALMSATGSVALFVVAREMFSNTKTALISVFIYAFSTGVFRFSCQVEYLVLVPSFALISLVFFVKKQYLISGIILGLGLLTSPFVLLFSPMYFLFVDTKKIFIKQNFIFLAGLFVMYFVVNIFTFKETVSGHWSYGIVFDFYQKVILELNYFRIASIWVYGYLRSFNLLVFAIPFSLIYSYKHFPRLFVIFLLTLILHLPVAVPEARYGGYQMTVYPIVALVLANSIVQNFESFKKTFIAFLTLYLLINLNILFIERSFHRTLRDTYVKMNQDLPTGSVLFTYHASKPIMTVYATRLKAFTLLSDYQEANATHLQGYIKPNLSQLMKQNNTYLLESGMSYPDDYIKNFFASFVSDQGAKQKGFGLFKLSTIESNIKFERIPGYELDVYKVIYNK